MDENEEIEALDVIIIFLFLLSFLTHHWFWHGFILCLSI